MMRCRLSRLSAVCSSKAWMKAGYRLFAALGRAADAADAGQARQPFFQVVEEAVMRVAGLQIEEAQHQ